MDTSATASAKVKRLVILSMFQPLFAFLNQPLGLLHHPDFNN